MKRRRIKDYTQLFTALKNEAKTHNLVLDPQVLMADFELAVIASFRLSFKNAKVKGCLFHFGQSLFKKLSQLHLKEDYLEDESFRVKFKSLFNFIKL